MTPLMTINRNVDSRMGNLNFKGKINLNGSVAKRHSIVATDRIVITGTIAEGASVVSGSSVRVENGILGGRVWAQDGIETLRVGTPNNNVETLIAVAINPVQTQKLDKLNRFSGF